jgi:cell division protein FtsQ
VKKLLNTFQIFLISFVLIGLYAFTNKRNNTRIVEGITLEFTSKDNLYTNYAAVNKLLILKNKGQLKQPKEKVALSTIEQWLNEDPMLQNATVYMTVDGVLRALLTQKIPVARVLTDSVFYLDEQGDVMPLSEFHSARVPIITGNLSKKSLEDCHKLVVFIAQDVFLTKNIVGIEVQSEKHYTLKCRMEDFDVVWGDAQELQEKTSKLKAFYNKAINDQSLAKYKLVDVRFKNQVVATKKL